MLEVIKPHWQVISMTQCLKFSNDLKEFSNRGHSLFVCFQQMWLPNLGHSSLFLSQKKKKKSVSQTWINQKKKKNHMTLNISTFHFFDCPWRPNPTMFKKKKQIWLHAFNDFDPFYSKRLTWLLNSMIC